MKCDDSIFLLVSSSGCDETSGISGIGGLYHMNKTVLITGASSGIGFELSRIFSRNGFAVIMTARDPKKLSRAVKAVDAETGAKVISIAMDLSEKGSAEKLFREITRKKIMVDILINNAGFGQTGPFLETDLRTDLAMIELNITTLTILTKLFARNMKECGSGKILNVASTGSYMPGPFIAEYYAAKAYVLSFTEALAYELKGSGVFVSALCPGATRTEFAKRAGKSDVAHAMSAEKVARIAYKHLMNNKRIIIPGVKNKIGIIALKIIPRIIIAGLAGRFQKKLHQSHVDLRR
jgi:uncharacterized protein